MQWSRRATNVYTDYSPFPNFPPIINNKGHRVVVVEGGEKEADVIDYARAEGLTAPDADGVETFWIVFASEPRRVWDFTEDALRRTLRPDQSTR